jgi:membrane-associated phospholipid phosphatase
VISKVYFGVHYLSDVLVGGLIGYTIGWLVFKNRNAMIKKVAGN